MKKDKIDIELSGAVNDKYKAFFEKFNEIETLDPSFWKVAHVLGYFCKKYKEYYNSDYQFKFNTPLPSKCFEVFQIKKLSIQLTSNPVLLKDYIDWIFINKVAKSKRKLTSISFMTSEDVVNYYKLNVLFTNTKIDRSTLLPEKYKIIFANIGSHISTYGDLAFIFQMANMPLDLSNAFNKIEEIGFDKNILERIV